jgi:hypothetical protein
MRVVGGTNVGSRYGGGWKAVLGILSYFNTPSFYMIHILQNTIPPMQIPIIQ